MESNTIKSNNWKNIDWTKVTSNISRLQRRIYKQTQRNNLTTVKYLQSKIINSLDAKLLATMRVTSSRYTGGVDKISSLKPEEKWELAHNIKLKSRADYIRRVEVPKPRKKKKRPLCSIKVNIGIPTMRDRATQALVKLALEPQWEARFEAESYGFRPQRNCWDATRHCYRHLRNKGKTLEDQRNWNCYVLDADIDGCFDNINHTLLLEKLDTTTEIIKQIKAWLKAGIMKGFQSQSSSEIIHKTNPMETPLYSIKVNKGGVISPLLANIALHGMVDHLKDWVTTQPSYSRSKDDRNKRSALGIVRYADDFVIIHKSKDIIDKSKLEVNNWLTKNTGLKLSEEKTKISNCQETGFHFLGFHHILIKRGTRIKVKIYPSRGEQAKFLLKIRKTIQDMKAASSYEIIETLNPIITGWANYYQVSESKSTFSKLCHLIFQKLRAWVFRRATKQSRIKLKEKYFPKGGRYEFHGRIYHDNWTLTGHKHFIKENKTLHNHLTKISWFEAKSTICCSFNRNKGNPFEEHDFIEMDHMHPKHKGGKDSPSNLQLLHVHCLCSIKGNNRGKTKKERSLKTFTEEPDDMETVTSGSVDEVMS